MKIVVLGAGVIGVSSAYYLAKKGFAVEVIDRQPLSANETSFANLGQISPGFSAPWAGPGLPTKLLSLMLKKDAPLVIRFDGTLFQLRWMVLMLRNCNEQSYLVNKERMMRIANYSCDCIKALRSEIDVKYEGRQGGTLQLFRTAEQFAGVEKDLGVLRSLGVAHTLIDAKTHPEQLLKCEPGLRGTMSEIVGALHLPDDETGDCHLFTQELTQQCKRLGVKFRFGETVERLVQPADRIEDIVVNGSLEKPEHVVLAMGSYSRQLLLKLHLDIPVYPVKGYSLTMPLLTQEGAPLSTIVDDFYKVAVTRFDQRLRVGGMAELGGFDLRLASARRARLEKVLAKFFPNIGDLSRASFWTGLRPMMPDGTPVIGATPLKNLWLNTGHGTLGWTMACGAGRLLSDIIAGAKTDISTEGLSMVRYGEKIVRQFPR